MDRCAKCGHKKEWVPCSCCDGDGGWHGYGESEFKTEWIACPQCEGEEGSFDCPECNGDNEPFISPQTKDWVFPKG